MMLSLGIYAQRALGTYLASQASLSASGLAWATAHSTQPLSRSLVYGANDLHRNLMPDPSTLIGAWYAGRLTYEQLVWSLGFHGIDLPATLDGEPTGRQDMWVKCLLAHQPIADLAVLRTWWARDRINPDDWQTALKRHGIWGTQWQEYVESAPNPLPESLILACLHRGVIDADEAHSQLLAQGYGSRPDRINLLNPPTPLPLEPLFGAYNRRLISQEEFHSQLKATGIGKQEDRDALEELTRQIPGPSDLVMFALKEVWDRNVVERFGYDAEFPAEFKYWMDKQGFDWGEDVRTPDGQVIPGVTWPQAYWRAHWDVISPQQAYEMLHRLRGNPADQRTWRVPGVRPFTQDDVRQILKIHDYPVPFRDQLAAISYRVIQRRDILNLAKYNAVKDDEIAPIFEDQGYSRQDAERLAKATVQQKNHALFNVAGHETIAQIRTAYDIGTISYRSAAVMLWRVKEARPVGHYDEIDSPPQADVDLATADPWVVNSLISVDHEHSTKIAKERIEVVHRQYLRGQLDATSATALLVRLGIRNDRVSSYVTLWAAEATKRGKELPASHALRLFRQGLITAGQVSVRLRNLGYQEGDITEMIALTSIDIMHDKAKVELMKAKDRKAQEKARTDAIKAQQRRVKQHQTALAHSASQADVMKFYKAHLIEREQAYNRLVAIGILPPDAEAKLELADQKSGVSGNGTGKGKPPAGHPAGG